MFEYLSPLATLFKLLVDGLTKASGVFKGIRKKEIQRRIIEIQLSLEDIIDRAQEIISTIEKFDGHKIFREQDTESLRLLLSLQNHKIYRFMDLLSDDISDDILKLFAPEARRRIWDLINLKGGFIQELIRSFNYSDGIKFKDDQIAIESTIFDWNHDAFIKEGHPYLLKMNKSMKNILIPVTKRQKEQINIVNELIACSRELSDFIKSKIKIEDIVIRKDNSK